MTADVVPLHPGKPQRRPGAYEAYALIRGLLIGSLTFRELRDLPRRDQLIAVEILARLNRAQYIAALEFLGVEDPDV